jgi:hypothetical protein
MVSGVVDNIHLSFAISGLPQLLNALHATKRVHPIVVTI